MKAPNGIYWELLARASDDTIWCINVGRADVAAWHAKRAAKIAFAICPDLRETTISIETSEFYDPADNGNQGS